MASKKCAACKRKAVKYVIRNAWQSSANGKGVCDANWCWTVLTGGYPAEGRAPRDHER